MTDTDADTEAPDAAIGARTSSRVRLVVLGVLVVVVGGALVANAGAVGDLLDEVRDVVDRAGAGGPLLFVAAYAVLTALLVPGSPLTVAGGVLFGPFLGTAYVVVGATLGATAAFLWGRRLGRDAVASRAGSGAIGRLDAWLSGRGLLAVLYLRLVPIVPFNVTNPVAGVSGIAARDFVIGTAVGIIPGTYAFAALGGSIDDLTSPTFLSALALLVVLAVAAPFADRRFGAGRRPDVDAAPADDVPDAA